MKGRVSREIALRALYQVDVGKGEPALAFAHAKGAADAANDAEIAFAQELFMGVSSHVEEVDGWIGGLARGWDVKRMAAIDRNILRLAAYELVYRQDVPALVVITEAVELAKQYSTADSGKFVNGILSALAAHLPGRLPGEEEPGHVSETD